MNASLQAADASAGAASERHQLLSEAGEVLVTVVFFVTALAGLYATRSEIAGTCLFWPANALAAALMVRLPKVPVTRTALGLFLAGVIANALGDNQAVPEAALMSLGDLVEILLAVYLLRGPLRMSFPEIGFADGARLFALLGVVIPAAGAVPGALAAHLAYGVAFGSAAGTWYVSAASGAILCAPTVYLCSGSRLAKLVARPALKRNLAIAVGCLVFTFLTVRFLRYPLVIMGVPLLISGYWIGAFGAALLCELVGVFMVALWTFGVRPLGMVIPLNETGVLAGLPFMALAALMVWPVITGFAADEKQRAIRALRENEQRFRQSLRHSPLGVMMLGLDGRLQLTNDACLEMLGYTWHELESIGSEEILHPDDLENAKQDMRGLLSGAADSYVAERRYRHRDGSWVWARTVSSVVSDDDGLPLHLISHVESMEARRRAERDLAEERERLRTTLAAIGDAVLTTDAAGEITYANAAAEDLVGRPVAELVGRRIDDVVVLTNPQTRNPIASVVALCVTRGEPVRRPERCLLRRPDGTPRYVLDNASPVNDADGAVTGAVVVLQDATEGFERDRELHHRAAHDPLTGLTNRFEFEGRLTECLNGYRYMERPATLLLIDLDRFKEVNDTGGHAAGDEMLRRVARELASVVRDTDTVARLGGDEFAILLTQGDPVSRAEQIGARLLRAIAELSVTFDGVQYSVGASVGAASLGPHIEDLADWLAAADRACYDAKRAGRGQMRIGT